MIHNSCYESELKELTPSEIEACYGPFDNIDEVDSFGDTLLLASCKNKQIDYVRHYLKLGADVNYVNECGDSPIHVLIDTVHHDESKSVEIVKVLLDSNADIELRAYMDKTPFLRACCRQSLKMLQLLVSAGCNTSAVVEDGDKSLNGVWFSECFHLPKNLRQYIEQVVNS
ncbi:ankyrin repeat domain-containing protein [Microbulbifer hainanensis]|uniref:ankyrin repeat domain-containing protein n=1 Tax=Microbulbifer hainanensis TaxID=2735675 RepID=UPI0018666A61|nr:ankyrin repeat domain-containing protein [Microbulbifer hainanensis]